MGEVVSYTKEGIEDLIAEAVAGLGAAEDAMGVALHGTDPNFARPEGYTVVYWIGSAEPVNALTNDFRVDPTGIPVTFATQEDIDASIAELVDTAPSTLDTLNELAAALGDDANFAATTATSLGNKADKDLSNLTVDIATQAELDAIVAALSVIGQNTPTASYQLVLSDAGKVVEMDVAGANNLTIPTDATVAFPVGTVIELWQKGAGQTTVVPAGGVTLRSPGGLTSLYGQYSGGTLRKRAANEWVLQGDLS